MSHGGQNSLKKCIDSKKGVHRNKFIKYFVDLVEGVSYLHNKNIVHRDLKLENVVVDIDEGIKLVDFGFATIQKSRNEKLRDICGTPNYMSPQTTKRELYNPKKNDVWALGIIYYYCLFSEFPFKGKD